MEIKVEKITKRYNSSVVALKENSFVIPNGLFGLIGRNGAGKTTFLRILATAMEATGGSIYYDGVEQREDIKGLRKKIGYLPQNTKLMPHLNLVEFLDYMAVLKGINDEKQRKGEVNRCISLVGLEEHKKKRLSGYSGGMLRRAGIAQALLGDPELLIVDEPTTGLDPEERIYFINVLSKLALTKTLVLSTHITADVENICDNVAILEEGVIQYCGDIDALIESLRGRTWEVKVSIDREEELKEKLLVTRCSVQKRKLLVRYIAEQSMVENSELVEPVLEDAYVHILGGVKR